VLPICSLLLVVLLETLQKSLFFRAEVSLRFALPGPMERGSGSGHSAYAADGIAFGRAALAFAWGAPSSVNVSADGYHRSVNISQPTDAVSSFPRRFAP
jgi:hypothetical protein